MLVLLVLVFFWGLSYGEVFTAMADMEAMLGAEKQITNVVDQYIAQEMTRLKRLKE